MLDGVPTALPSELCTELRAIAMRAERVGKLGRRVGRD
jgi:hypothetical protein